MHERVSVNSWCFPTAGLPELADAWRELQPRRVSMSSLLVRKDTADARRILDDGGYRLDSLAHPVLWGRPLDADEQTWDKERSRLSRAIDGAAELGARSVYLTSGGHGDLIWEDAAQRFSAGIASCVAHAEAVGIELAVETSPSLYADAHLPHTLRDTVLLAELAGIGVCIDIYACWTEAGLQKTIERAAPRCTLVQVSDYVYGDRSVPSRAVPGDGNIPLRRILEWILATGYTGSFDLELIGPRIDAEGQVAAARRSAEALGTMLAALGA